VRVPFADLSTYPVPAGVTDEEFLMLADILPTAFEVGVLNGHVSPGDVVAVIGAGPVGLSAIVGARLFSPSQIISIDLASTRLDAAKRFGADVIINNGHEDAKKAVDELTDGLGVDVAIEAVGMAATFELAAELIRPGGRLANVGVHGAPATLHLESLWTRDVTITTGLVDTSSTPILSRLIKTHQIDAAPFITHRLRLDEIEKGYELSADAATSGALKIVFTTI
jgi:alcohol dehydrogenase